MTELIKLEDLPDDYKIYLEDSFRKELLRKAVKRVGGFVKLSKELDFDWSSLCKLRRGYRILKGRQSIYFIRISLLKKLSQLVGLSLDDVEKYVVGIAYSKHMVEAKLPILISPELASLIGHAMGDGHASVERFKYISKTKELTSEVRYLIKKVFGAEGREFTERELYHGIEFPGIISRLLAMAGTPLGRKVVQEFEIPTWIKQGSREIKLAFVRALFDDEGSFILGKHQQFISISMYKHEDFIDSHIQFLDDVRKILFELSVETGKVFHMKDKKGTKEFGFGIYKKSSLIKFGYIGFTHKTKSGRLTSFIKAHSNESLISNKSLFKV